MCDVWRVCPSWRCLTRVGTIVLHLLHPRRDDLIRSFIEFRLLAEALLRELWVLRIFGKHTPRRLAFAGPTSTAHGPQRAEDGTLP
jgi:hypothetical protein